MVNALVVHCHPCADSLGAAARDAVLDGLRAGGGTAQLIDLYASGFSARADDAVVRQHISMLRSCELLILVYPTWWAAQPAMLRSWFEQGWLRHSFGPVSTGRGTAEHFVNIRRLVVVTTHGSPKWINAVQGESGKHFLQRRVRRTLHPRARVEWLALYGLDHEKPGDTERFLTRIRDRFARIG